MTSHRTFKNKWNLLLLSGISCLVLACDAYVRIPGKVLDEQGRPIEGATITVYSGSHKLAGEESNKDGRFDISKGVSPIGTSKIKVVVSKEGFLTSEQVFNARDLPLNPNVDPNIPKERVITLLRENE